MKENSLHTNSGKKQVGVWIRVSTDEQAQGDSPKHHELRARAYAEARGWDVREVYDLAGMTGKSVMEYPETKRMMDDVRQGRITGLIFSKLARFARNTIELLTFSEFFQEHGADLISLQEAIDTSTPAGRLFFSVNASLAQFEREEIASRVAASVPIRAKLGKPLGGAAPFGYEWKDKKLVVNPKDAAVRKLVYELFAEHRRKKTVARILNDRGFRTRTGGKFSDTTVARLITDTTAKGEHRLNYTKSVGNGKAWTLKPEHEWIVNRVEPIVPLELWDRCNVLLENRRTKGERPQKKGKNPLSGLVRCDCGKKMYIPFDSPKWVCYSCRNKIPVADLESAFREEIKGFMVAPEKVAEYREKAQSGLAGKSDVLTGLRKEREKVKAEADRCFELYQAGALTVGQFKERFQPVDARRHEIEREIPRLEAEIDAMNVDGLSCEQVASEGRDFYSEWPKMSEDKKRAVAELIVKEIVVGKDDLTINLFALPILEIAVDGQRILRGSWRRRA